MGDGGAATGDGLLGLHRLGRDQYTRNAPAALDPMLPIRSPQVAEAAVEAVDATPTSTAHSSTPRRPSHHTRAPFLIQ